MAFRPYKLSISSRNMRREHRIGSFNSMGDAYKRIHWWRVAGKQAPGCIFYLQNVHTGAEYIVR